MSVDRLIDLKDAAVDGHASIVQLVTDAQLGRKTDMEALSAIGNVSLGILDEQREEFARQEAEIAGEIAERES